MKLFGKFQIKVKNVVTGKETDTGWLDNIVLNNAFNKVTPNGGYYIQLGTGSATPSVSDLALDSFLVSVSVGASNKNLAGASTSFSSPVYSSSAGWEEVFPLGAVVGNVSEIGLSGSASGDLITRALITDALGDPTTITVGINDILTVNYLVGYEVDTSHPAGVSVVDFNGNSINLTAKWVDLGNGSSNSNQMIGKILPYMVDLTPYTYVDILDVLPTDPLVGMAGSSSLRSFLVTDRWNNGITATGSSWVVSVNFELSKGLASGDWVGIAIGPDSGTPMVIFEFSAPVTKLDNQQFTMTLKFEIQRD